MYRMDVRSAIKQQSHSACVSVACRPAKCAFAGGMDVRALVEEYFDEGGVAIVGCLDQFVSRRSCSKIVFMVRLAVGFRIAG